MVTPIKLHETETELLKEAAAAFERTTGIRVRIQRLEPRRGTARADARLRFVFPQAEWSMDVEIKPTLTTQTLGPVVDQITRLADRALLVTRYVNPNLAVRLKEFEIPFLDTLGNAYLNDPPVFIYIRGRETRPFPKQRPTRAFVPSGLRIVFALLCRQELATAPFRTIAQTAHVALGTVGWVLRDLKGHGHLVDMGKRGRRLMDKQRLLDRWVATFPDQLRPKLVLGRYAAPDPTWWQKARIREFHAYWGAEPAAARLTGYLKPELVTVYIRDSPERFLAANRLRADPEGDVEVLKAFWDPMCDWTDPEIAPPLLVYADLLATADPRNLETARRIYDEQLAGLVREN